MKNLYNSAYRQEYYEGYAEGGNPFSQNKGLHYSEAYNAGFISGRLDYEMMNGFVSDGIPPLIVTSKVLDDFMLAGMLGLPVDSEGYTPYQLEVICRWYESGTEKYDPLPNLSLHALLELNGIEIG